MQDLSNIGNQHNLPGKKHLSYAFLEILQTILIAVAFYFVVDAVIGREEVFNVSMEPTIYEGEVIFVNKLAYRLGKVDRGDIVIFHSPYDAKENFLKRVIGLPGDEIKISAGKVYINGKLIEEPYLKNATLDENMWVVPEDMYFVMGDNRQNSVDSRSWGFVPQKDLIGKALAVYWPLSHVRILKHVNIYP